MRVIFRIRKPKIGPSDLNVEVTQKFEIGEGPGDREVEGKAQDLVNDTLLGLLNKLQDLGYDFTDVQFSIRKIKL